MEVFTPDQEQAIRRLINGHTDVQMLLSRILELETEVMQLREAVESCTTAVGKNLQSKKAARTALGDGILDSPVALLAQVMTGVRRYVEVTANEGYAARRTIGGDYVIDLEAEELRQHLPPGKAPSYLYRIVRQARGYTRRVNDDERAFMNWNPSRGHKYSLVYLPGA